MRSRIDFGQKLKDILGLEHTYFQPSETVKMVYPCAVYQLNNLEDNYANDKPYLCSPNYMVTIIDKDPDSEYPAKIREFRYCRFDRFYTADNLNHWVFEIYF